MPGPVAGLLAVVEIEVEPALGDVAQVVLDGAVSGAQELGGKHHVL